MQANHLENFGRKSNLLQKETIDPRIDFNDEELYYLNRVAFRLFKLNGTNLSFLDFVKDLNTL